jgi:MFS family permease
MVSDASRRNVLLASALGSSLAPFMVAGLLVALPTIGQEFVADASLLGWLTNVFFLAAAVFLVPFGRVADVRGTKKVFTTGIAVYFFSVIHCILAPNIQFLIGARFITGIGAAMVFGTSIAILSLVHPESERGKAIGINVTAMSMGFLLGFFLGGLLTFYTGWRSIFLVTIPIELLVVWLILSRIRGECELAREKELDIPGMILYGCAILLAVIGFSILTEAFGTVLLAGGLLFFLVFILQERRKRHPLLDLRFFVQNKTFRVSNLTVLLFNSSNFALIFLITLYLQNIRMIDARIAGVILLIPVVFMALFSTYAGRLSDRTAPRMVVGGGIGVSSLALFLFTFLHYDTPLILVVGALSLYGLGIAFCQSPLVRTSVSSVPKEMYGLASGMIETMRLIGMTISIAISILVFNLIVGDIEIAPEAYPLYISSIRLVIWIYLVISLAALVLAIFSLKRDHPVHFERPGLSVEGE